MSADTRDHGGHPAPSRWRALLPLAVFLALVVALAVGLTLNPREVPSPLIGQPVPAFDLPPVKGRTLGLSSAVLGKGEVSLVNVFASWCVACREEHSVLMDLKARGLVPIHGLNYKDQPDDAARWLAEWGDPYTRTGADVDGRVGIDWGVYGVPETFVIGPDGRIAYKHIGPITPEFVSEQLIPMIERLRRSGKP
ncbi:DsbE family thiol:disulfide interchange protein [Denitromonas iodatirespirans]|uniref:DsbE family thiol:disulfide interchange protein n=1 Tax=Denitromonas iodatirespirans TaxID=2795389 RepID=A0A944D950_DENI1|nr:DsbE family thiol:disulfide interchange protein [Denitromonas iodatirespirans]MBT0960298.1 DsbE family thiol:disulfide interchange protein [Denitromonas iodatirespirans]